MQTAYVQKNETAQRAADNTAAAVHDNSPQSESLQRHASLANAAVQRAENPPRPNNTGLPDDLKNGIESLSGYSLDNVRVHYNSPKPATVQALAFTQGNDIHVAPGQEHALPHEAWHVTQQMAGRVTPTTNIGGMPVNDNAALEHEADVMGEKAVQCKGKAEKAEQCKMPENGDTLQCEGEISWHCKTHKAMEKNLKGDDKWYNVKPKEKEGEGDVFWNKALALCAIAKQFANLAVGRAEKGLYGYRASYSPNSVTLRIVYNYDPENAQGYHGYVVWVEDLGSVSVMTPKNTTGYKGVDNYSQQHQSLGKGLWAFHLKNGVNDTGWGDGYSIVAGEGARFQCVREFFKKGLIMSDETIFGGLYKGNFYGITFVNMYGKWRDIFGKQYNIRNRTFFKTLEKEHDKETKDTKDTKKAVVIYDPPNPKGTTYYNVDEYRWKTWNPPSPSSSTMEPKLGTR